MKSPADSPDDESLLRAVAARDETAFAQLYDRVSPPVFSMLVRVLRSKTEAEEVLQESFCQIWERASDYRPELGSAFGWIVTVARRKAIDRLRTNSRHLERIERALAKRAEEDFFAPLGLEALADGERDAAVEQALAALNLEERRAIALAFFEGLTHEEIAAILEAPVGTVKARIRRGLLKLKPALAKMRRTKDA